MIKLISILTVLLISTSVLGLNKQKDCKCKIIPQNDTLGNSTTKNIYPWSISLFLDLEPNKNLNETEKLKYHRCEAIIVNEYHVLTSYYCSPIGYNFLYFLSAGSNDIVELYNQKRYKFESFVNHPNTTYHPKKKNVMINDLVLIKLAEPIEFNEKVQPACFDLKDVEEYLDGNLATIGHGYNGVISGTINEVEEAKVTRYMKEINLLDNSTKDKEECWYDANICAVGKNGIESPCYWDHGNPLMITRDNGNTSVIGVLSTPSLKFLDDQNVIACLGSESSIYLRMSKYWNWVRKYIGDDYCESE